MQIRLSGEAEEAVREMMAQSDATAKDIIRRALGTHKMLTEERANGATVWVQGKRGGRREIIVR